MKPTLQTLIHAKNEPKKIWLSGSDYIVSNVGIPMILFFSETVDTERFQRALEQVVADWYILAGRIRANKNESAYIDCNDEGLVFEVFEHSSPMPKPSVNKPLRNGLRKYHPLILPWQVENKSQAPCVVQLHHFTKGTIFSLTCCHSVADGWGMWAVIDAISNAMLGEAYTKPDHSRDTVLDIAEGYIGNSGRRPQSSRLTDTNYFQKVIFTLRLLKKVAFPKPNEIMYLSAETIEGLRAIEPDVRLSRQDIAIGLIAMGMKLGSVGALANMRLDNASSIQKNYSGNALTYREFSMGNEKGEEAEGSILYFARKWRDETINDDGSDAIEYMAHLEHRLKEGTIKKVVPLSMFKVFADGILINNYSVFPIYNVDFGGGTAEWYEMSPFPFRGALITNTPENDGGLLLNLTADQWQLDAVRALINNVVDAKKS